MSNSQSTPDRRRLTVVQAAQRLGISRSKVYALMESGRLPYYRVDSARRIDVADLEKFDASCRVGPHDTPGVVS